MSKAAIIWFRNDLRIHDNESLLEAVHSADILLPVYIFDERVFTGFTKYGFRKTGVMRANFIIEGVHQLRATLKSLGSDLIVKVGKPEEILFNLAQTHKTSWIFCNRERTDEEVKVQDLVEKLLWSIGQEMRYNRGKMLYYTADLPFPVTHTPDNFAAFRKEVEKLIGIRKPLNSPEFLPPFNGSIDVGTIPDLYNLGYSSEEISAIPGERIRGGENAGLNFIEGFISNSKTFDRYTESKNKLSSNGVDSRIGAYLSQGFLSPKFVYHKLPFSHSNSDYETSSYTLFVKLILRDYFRLLGKKYGNEIFKLHGPKQEVKDWNSDFRVFKIWAEGKTGIPLIDANMRQLNNTGYMSEIGRNCTASFLVNNLGINWLIGAEYFESKLIDYDPCSNYGNWNNIAGVGLNGKDSRTNSILFQSRKHDPQGEYLKKWLPELKKLPPALLHKPDEMDITEQTKYNCILGKDYPLPILSNTDA